MNLLKQRIQRIKNSLREHDLDLAASLLINTVASDDMFAYWSKCCHGSERVPKILKFIKHITFDQEVPTAVINFMKGDLGIGVQFFIDYIEGPEDLLFILIHERDHLILRKLYPGVLAPDYPKQLINFAEDAYINAISRRYTASTLPERFYDKPVELLLTARHSRIDWDVFKTGSNNNQIKEAHGALYQLNYALLGALNEKIVISSNNCGYREWMELILGWHNKMREQPKQIQPSEDKMGETADGKDAKQDPDNQVPDKELAAPGKDSPAVEDENKAEDQDESTEDTEVSESGKEHHPPDKEDGTSDADEEEAADSDEDGINDGKDTAVAAPRQDYPNHADPDAEPDNPDQDEAGNGVKQGDAGIDAVLENIAPLVQEINTPSSNCTPGRCEKANGMLKMPMPDLKPNDPVVQLILSTCENIKFRDQVNVFEGDILKHVEGMIKGILSDRATTRSYDGYSVSVPYSIARRDVFTLSAGDIPVLWQKRVGVERPCIDVYVDVSGSMSKYYGYIPFIYDALKHVMGRIFQFSTKIVEVHYQDRYLNTTGGTNFNVVAHHMIEEQATCAILLSDGISHISNLYMDTLKGQLAHLVYIKIKENICCNWEHLATDVILLQKRGEA